MATPTPPSDIRQMRTSRPVGTSAERRRTLLGRLLVVIISLLAGLALVTAYVQHVAGDAEQLADRATVALQEDGVRSLVAERVTDEVILAQEADLLAARPVIQGAVERMVGSEAFGVLFRAGVLDLRRGLLDRDEDTVTLAVADVGTVLAAALAGLQPELAQPVRRTGEVEIVRRDIGDAAARVGRVVHDMAILAVLLGLAAAALAAVALRLSRDRRSTFCQLGFALAAAGALVVVALGVSRSLVVGGIDDLQARAAVAGIWDAFLQDLRNAGWILAAIGAVIAAAARSALRPAPLGEPLRALGRWAATEPQRPAGRVLRGLALAGVGVLVLVARDELLVLASTVLGVYLLYEGLGAVLRVAAGPGPEDAPAPAPRGMVRRRLATVALPAALAALAAGTFLGTGGVTAAPPTPVSTCNGHEELCDRPLDDVALAATHNSMSVPLPGWFSAEHEKPIADQLRAGIRGLLIDTHEADLLPGGRLRTDLDDRLDPAARADGLSKDAVDSALRLRRRLGFSGEGRRDLYVCHGFCELGGTLFSDVLRDLREFLVANPGEVLVVINQDEVAPAKIVAAVRAAGLESLMYDGPVDGEWPTLREMIDSGQRLVLLAEKAAGGAPWYRTVYDAAVQETPFSFASAAELTDRRTVDATCAPNRGPTSAPLFLVNHWVTTDPLPRPSDAEKVNAYGPLMRRLRACERVRGRKPNLVAVNFYGRGALLRAVDALNGVAP